MPDPALEEEKIFDIVGTTADLLTDRKNNMILINELNAL